MEPRVRVGVMAGIIPAIAAFFLAFVALCVGGMIAAPLAGYNAGARIGRDRAYAQQPGTAGAIAGLAAGTLTAVGQLVGMILTVALEQNYLRQQLATYPGYGNAADLLWPAIITSAIIFGLLEVGLAAGAGALAANTMARRAFAMPTLARQDAPYASPSTGMRPPSAAPSQTMADDVPPARPAGPPPAYPPPPSYYRPDAPAPDAPAAAEDVPPQTGTM
jgi:hypothetical protein